MSVPERIKEIIGNIFRTFYWTTAVDAVTDIVDIILVAFIFYQLIKLVRQTRAVLLLKGIVIVVAAYLVSSYFNLAVVNYIMQSLFQNSVLALLIIFQPEIRRVLEQTGRSKLSSINIFSSDQNGVDKEKLMEDAIFAVYGLVTDLQRQKMGALIVFERLTKLGEVVDTGSMVDALPSRLLLGNIFFNKAPLHDGATIIRDGRVLASGCILPLSENTEISLDLGTRHRAALGVSEISDAVVVVVSEETGAVSLAMDGELRRNISREILRQELENLLVESTSSASDKKKKKKSSAKDGED